MKIREVFAKSVLTGTGIRGYDYCINPYTGCAHGCTYCYASFMKRFTGHQEPWGRFLDVKMNAPEVVRRQLKRVKAGSVLVGTVTDPYQPAEKKYAVTRGCLEALSGSALEVHLLTKSPLCLRDMDLFQASRGIEVGVTVSTNREEMRKLFEPSAPSVHGRIEALKILHRARVRTYAFIGPLLPLDAPRLIRELSGAVDEVLIDRMNYSHKVKALYGRAGLSAFLEGDYFEETAHLLTEGFEERGI